MNKARLLAFLLGLMGLLLIGSCIYYQYNISPIDSGSKANIEVIIEEGMTTRQIARLLYDKKLIRSELFFKLYLKLNNAKTLKASTYLFTKSMSLEKIVEILEIGNKDVLTLTFKEGKNIKDYAEIVANNTTISKEDFINKTKEKEFLGTLIKDYWFLTDNILDENIYYPLEGYLFPDTYQFDKNNVSSEIIIRTLLEEEKKKLVAYKSQLEEKNIHSIMTLASIAELEGVKDEDRKTIISVFNNRLEKGMNLGSDVTTYYAFDEKMDSDLTVEMFNTYNPYNTRSSAMAGKIPVGPICNPSLSSIDAAINPNISDYLYFVADKNRNVYFTRSASEHTEKVQELKKNGDWIW